MSSSDSESEYGSEPSTSSGASTASETIQCETYSGIWIGGGGTWVIATCDLLSKEETQNIIDNYSLSSWCCGVAILKYQNEPLDNSKILADFISDTFDEYFIVGEITDKGVHHTHFMIKTSRRIDVNRRELYKKLENSKYTIELCKFATTRNWSGMFHYLCKNPLSIYTGNKTLANLAFTIIERGDALKYLKKEEPDNSKNIVKDINKIIEDNNCTCIEDVFKFGGTIITKYLHISSLKNVIENCLTFQSSKYKTWNPFSFRRARDKDPQIIHRILAYQGIDIAWFDEMFWKWITRQNGKKNTIMIIGQSNTGKSTFIRGLTQLIPTGFIVNTSSPFFAEGLCGKVLGVWEEPLLMPEQCDTFKSIAEGSLISLPQKFKKPFILHGIPIIITTNHKLTRFCESEHIAIYNRIVELFWNNITPSSSGICGTGCVRYFQQQRIGTPCYLDWSASSGNVDWESQTDSDWDCSSRTYSLSICGRWWCRSNNHRPCSYCFGTKIKRTNTGGFELSTSATTCRNNRSDTRNKTRSTGDGISNRDTKPLLRPIRITGYLTERDSNTDSPRCGDGKLGSGGDRGNVSGYRESADECETLYSGRERSGTDKGKTEKRETTNREICSCLVEPTKWDWQAYIAFLADKYG